MKWSTVPPIAIRVCFPFTDHVAGFFDRKIIRLADVKAVIEEICEVDLAITCHRQNGFHLALRGAALTIRTGSAIAIARAGGWLGLTVAVRPVQFLIQRLAHHPE